MGKVRLCHSLWSKPLINHRWGITNQLENTAWFHALSVHYAKSVGAEIVLYTDVLGERMLSHLPYDNIYRILDDNPAPVRFWASGKIFAQEREPLGSIHIDSDVFIKKPGILDTFRGEYDIVAQMEEYCGFVNKLVNSYGCNMDMMERCVKKLGIENPTEQERSLNCGIVGFKNEKIKTTYIDGYKKLVEFAMEDEWTCKTLEEDMWACPDLIAEQWWLRTCAKSNNARVKVLLDNCDPVTIRAKCVDIGFTHVIGGRKYEQIGVVKRRLIEQNAPLYFATKSKLKEMFHE